MAGFMDWLLADQDLPGGGFPSHVLSSPDTAAPSSPYVQPAGLLGGSRLANAVRSAIAGAAAAQGYKGVDALAAGAAAGSLAAQRQRQQRREEALYRQSLAQGQGGQRYLGPGPAQATPANPMLAMDPFADMPLTLRQAIRSRAAYDPEGAWAMALPWLQSRPMLRLLAGATPCESCAKRTSGGAN